MVEQKTGGVLLGRARIAKKYENGGARHVTADIAGLKNNLVWAPWGGVLSNPFPGAAKLYECDPLYIEYDDKCENPKLWCVKSYLAAAASSGTNLKLVRDGFKHKVFVGDTLMVDPKEFGGAGSVANVVAVTAKTDKSGNKIWEVTLDAALTVAEGDVLVEGKSDAEDGKAGDGKWIINGCNGWTPCDMDFVYEPVADPEDVDDFDNAEYSFTPVAGVCAYTHRMSPLPEAILKLNRCAWNGIYMLTATPI